MDLRPPPQWAGGSLQDTVTELFGAAVPVALRESLSGCPPLLPGELPHWGHGWPPHCRARVLILSLVPPSLGEFVKYSLYFASRTPHSLGFHFPCFSLLFTPPDKTLYALKGYRWSSPVTCDRHFQSATGPTLNEITASRGLRAAQAVEGPTWESPFTRSEPSFPPLTIAVLPGLGWRLTYSVHWPYF